jgi:putative membrane protein
MLTAGCLFAWSVIGTDPTPHRPGRQLRAVVLVSYLAGHAVLAKYLYGLPPAGVPPHQAEAGAVLMYYGGDAVDAILLIVFCRQWLRPRPLRIDTADGRPEEVAGRIAHLR